MQIVRDKVIIDELKKMSEKMYNRLVRKITYDTSKYTTRKSSNS